MFSFLSLISSCCFLASLDCQIQEVMGQFQDKKGVAIMENVQLIESSEGSFYGIHRDQQMDPNGLKSTIARYEKLRARLLTQMGLPKDLSLIEIVGDSTLLSPKEAERATEFLHRYLPANAVIVYGYTGQEKADGRMCVNAVVSKYSKDHEALQKTIGTLVAYHTRVALDQWGCSGPQLQHYLLVYGNDESSPETGTVFGDDMITSDFLSDALLMIEGGIQSFRQACHFLLLDREILAYRVREDAEARFSASELIQWMKEKSKAHEGPLHQEVLDLWYNAYLETKVLPCEKKKDLDAAWSYFKSHKLYEKLDLFTCVMSS